MKKKLILACLIIGAAVLTVSALDVGIGAKLFPYNRTEAWRSLAGVTTKERDSMTDWGLYAFVDVKYLELGVGYYSLLSWEKFQNNNSTGTPVNDKLSYVDFSALLKFPLDIGGMQVFPMAGGSYKLNVGVKDEDGFDKKDSYTDVEKKDFNQLWLKAGLGVDLEMGGGLFVRATALAGYRLKTEWIKERQEVHESAGDQYKYNPWGLEVAVAAGIRF